MVFRLRRLREGMTSRGASDFGPQIGCELPCGRYTDAHRQLVTDDRDCRPVAAARAASEHGIDLDGFGVLCCKSTFSSIGEIVLQDEVILFFLDEVQPQQRV